MIVISVHNRDITENLIKNQIQNNKEFEWISQMR